MLVHSRYETHSLELRMNMAHGDGSRTDEFGEFSWFWNASTLDPVHPYKSITSFFHENQFSG